MGLNSASLGRFRAAADQAAIVVFRERLAALGEDIVLGATPLRVLVSEGDWTRDLVEGGFADEGTVRVKFLAQDLAALPVLGSAAQFQGRPYRVARARLEPGAISGQIDLRPVRR